MDAQLKTQIDALLADHKVVLFMKGTKHMPQCGFSALVAGALKKHGVEFKDINIFANPDLRSGMKEYSNWPTFPQLYVNGTFIGGSDIVQELEAQNEFGKLFTT